MAQESTNQGEGFTKQIRRELENLKAIAAAFGPDRLRDGTWFAEFIRAMLASYSEEIVRKGGADFFRRKYPGLTQDAIVDKVCDLAVRYAALAGGLSGFTSSAAVAATIGTAGGASVIAVPTAVAIIGTEVLYTTRLQVRLIYDISTVYGHPIELNDPEQLYRAFALAYGVSAVTGQAGAVTKTIAPEVTRAQLRGLIQGNTAAIQARAIQFLGPRIGRQITQKAVLKAAVPAVGVAISSGWNYVATKEISAIARSELRLSARARDAVRRLIAEYHINAEQAPVIAQAVLSVITADGTLDAREQEVYKAVSQTLTLPQTAIDEIESQVSLEPDEVEKRLRHIQSAELRQCIAELCQLAATVSGDIAAAEGDLVNRYVTALGLEIDIAKLREQAANFKRRETRLGQASRTVQQAAAKAAKGLRAAGKLIGGTAAGLVKRKPAGAESPSNTQTGEVPAPTIDTQEALRRLGVLYASGLVSEEEFEAQKKQLQGKAAPSPALEPAILIRTPTPSAAAPETLTLESARLQALINLAKVDGSVDEAESELLETLIAQSALTESDKQTLRAQIASAKKSSPNFVPFQREVEAAIGLVMDLIAVANINQKLHPAEKMYIRKVAEQLRLPKEDVEEMLTVSP